MRHGSVFNLYSSDTDICWVIRSDTPRGNVHLEVVASILQHHELTSNCLDGDYMEVKDGESCNSIMKSVYKTPQITMVCLRSYENKALG